MIGDQMIEVPRVLVEHFGYGTLRPSLSIWSPDDFPEMRELGDAWARAMGGDDPVPISRRALVKLYDFAGLLFGYYAHPYKWESIRRDERAGGVVCPCCHRIADLLVEARRKD